VVFRTALSELEVNAVLERELARKLGKPVRVLLRRSAELAGILAKNPFSERPPNRVVVLFFDKKLKSSLFKNVSAPDGEEIVVQGRELFIHYPNGQGRSRLKLPVAGDCTARNMNTVEKLVALAKAADGAA
jgi:uncharacterized protein (DUF1697 family)